MPTTLKNVRDRLAEAEDMFYVACQSCPHRRTVPIADYPHATEMDICVHPNVREFECITPVHCSIDRCFEIN
jgi:hypothetical protein